MITAAGGIIAKMAGLEVGFALNPAPSFLYGQSARRAV